MPVVGRDVGPEGAARDRGRVVAVARTIAYAHDEHAPRLRAVVGGAAAPAGRLERVALRVERAAAVVRRIDGVAAGAESGADAETDRRAAAAAVVGEIEHVSV